MKRKKLKLVPNSDGLEPRHLFDCGHCKFRWNCGPRCACAAFRGAGESENKQSSYPADQRWYRIEVWADGKQIVGRDALVRPALPKKGEIVQYQFAAHRVDESGATVEKTLESGETQMTQQWHEATYLRKGTYGGTLVCVPVLVGAGIKLAS